MKVSPISTGVVLRDPDDLILYEVTMAKIDENDYLITGNAKHDPVREFIVSPAER